MANTIKPQAREILRDHAQIEGTMVRLTCGQLSRPDYVAVNEALERAGGKWKGGKVQAHIFPHDPTEILQGIILTGELPPKNPLAFFPTPAPVVEQMITKAGGVTGRAVLEPSAGAGAIADVARSLGGHVVCVELNSYFVTLLRAKAHEVCEANFLDFTVGSYDRILMNPPFTSDTDRLAYIAHIRHAYDLLTPGGRLVAIAPNGFLHRADDRCAAFRALVQRHGGAVELPAGTFKESGTGVNTAMLWLDT